MDPELLGLDGHVALVTGGAAGIGAGCAMQLARAGCDIAIVDIDAEAGKRMAREIEALGRRALFVQADVLEQAQTERMVQETAAHFGRLDVAVNNVGGTGGTRRFLEADMAWWEGGLHRNLTTAFMCCQAEAKEMVARGTPGRIINVASTAGVQAAPHLTSYGAAKAGVIQLTKTLALELARYKIRVNCIVPGTHDTERSAAAQATATPEQRAFREATARGTPLRHLGTPLETGGVAVFFASQLSAYVTGHAVYSDGGMSHTSAQPAVPRQQ